MVKLYEPLPNKFCHEKCGQRWRKMVENEEHTYVQWRKMNQRASTPYFFNPKCRGKEEKRMKLLNNNVFNDLGSWAGILGMLNWRLGLLFPENKDLDGRRRQRDSKQLSFSLFIVWITFSFEWLTAQVLLGFGLQLKYSSICFFFWVTIFF